MAWEGALEPIGDFKWMIPRRYKECMNTDAIIFADEEMVPSIIRDNAPEQAANVACLPGIVGRSLAMPDIHWGYGFPIGGVAAMDAEEGVISPGGIGFDINCGVRLIRTNLWEDQVRPVIKHLISTLLKNVPAGLGSKGVAEIDSKQIDSILEMGSEWAVANGYGWREDLKTTEEEGRMKNADPSKVSDRAKRRGIPQVGSLGSGNHFLEVDRVERIFDREAAKTFGIVDEGQVTITVHCGSRGCGHQIATDYLKVMERSVKERNISLPDRQLACAPVNSREGEDYFSAMACGANFAWVNRQMITHWVRDSFQEVFKNEPEEMDMGLVYDVAHNIAKREKHVVGTEKREVYVHRKGATRAFPAGHEGVPAKYSTVGQPVIIPGDMGTGSYVLVGTQRAMRETFGSSCHGAGRLMSRKSATRKYEIKGVRSELEQKGIYVQSVTKEGIMEEAPGAYKDVDHVVRVVEGAGLARPIIRLSPIGVMKG